MSLVLQPQANFTVVRQISNHLDTDTNYVQAVIRNASTDAIIDTIQLDNKGGQRFTKNWQVPADTSGQGFYVSIVTSVYTDSGYTTKNGNYGDEEATYLVQERVLRLGGAGGGIDAYTVRKIVQEEMAKLPKPDPVSIPEPKELVDRTDEVLRAIADAKASIPPAPVIPKTDFAPVLRAVSDVRQAVLDKEVTPPTDLTPILSALTDTKSVIVSLLQHVGDSLVEMAKNVLTNELSKMKWTSTFVTSAKKGETPPLETAPTNPVPFDITKLAS